MMKRILLVFASATAYFLVIPTRNYQLLAWVMLVPFFAAVKGLPLKRAFFVGWLTGFLFYLVSHSWIVFTLREFGDIPSVGGIPILALFCLAHGLEFALFGLACAWLKLPLSEKKITPYFQLRTTLGLTCLIVTIEHLFPSLFPWNLGSAPHFFLPFIQMADITGVSGLSFILVMVNVSLWFLLERIWSRKAIPWVAIGAMILLFGLNLGYGLWRIKDIGQKMAASPKIRVSLVQPNIGNITKVAAQLGYERAIDSIEDALFRMVRSLPHAQDLILLPETSVPGYFLLEHDLQRKMFALSGEMASPLFFGGYHAEGEETYNTAFLIHPSGRVLGFFNKVYLLAYGEYLPLSKTFPFLKDLFPAAGDFSKGKDLKPIPMNGRKMTPLICYEAILPRFVRKIALQGSDILVNITNDSWFGKTDEPYQHLALTLFRAVEHRRSLIRATNTGVSAIIDPLGRIVQQAPLGEPATLQGSVPLLGETTWYHRNGEVFFFIFAILSLSTLIVDWKDKRKIRS